MCVCFILCSLIGPSEHTHRHLADCNRQDAKALFPAYECTLCISMLSFYTESSCISGHCAQCIFVLQNKAMRCWPSTYAIPGIVRIIDNPCMEPIASCRRGSNAEPSRGGPPSRLSCKYACRPRIQMAMCYTSVAYALGGVSCLVLPTLRQVIGN